MLGKISERKNIDEYLKKKKLNRQKKKFAKRSKNNIRQKYI